MCENFQDAYERKMHSPLARSNFTRFLTAVCVEMTNESLLLPVELSHMALLLPLTGTDPVYLHTGCHPKSPRPGDFRDVMRMRL